MSTGTSSALHKRLKKLKSRVLIHRWELRQRNHAKGSWFRLRRTLCSAEEAYAIPAQTTEEIELSGVKPLPIGFEFDPPLKLYWVTRERLEQIDGRHQLKLQLDRALLQAGSIALVAFEDQHNHGYTET